jgi:hypothetical protein
MWIPEHLEQAIDHAVARHLTTALGGRGLLLTAGELAAAESETAALGERLLASLLHQCYPMLATEFERASDVARIGGALAFGAVTSAVVAGHPGPAVELLCGTFNLGIGLIDGVCDGDIDTGRRLLVHLRAADLADAAHQNRERGWLRVGLPRVLADDPSVAFTVDVVEAFFETLHRICPDGEVLRTVGEQLGVAFDAEARSVGGSRVNATRDELIECSLATSVLPFEIIETLATGSSSHAERAASAKNQPKSRSGCTLGEAVGTLLGQAMWWIDDLVDLCDDARRGALNGVLIGCNDLERLLASPDVAKTAERAAASLDAGLRNAGDSRNAFLMFVQRYAGLPPL